MANNRWKNYGLWVSIIAFIGLILGNYGLYGVLGLTQDSYKQLADALLSIFVLAGIINNPSIGNGYNDKEDKAK